MTVFIIGAGAQGRVIADILRAQRYKSLEFVDDDHALLGRVINGVKVTRGFDAVLRAPQGDTACIIALGDPRLRVALGEKARHAGLPLLSAVHPSAVVAKSASVGEGVMVGCGAVLNSNARANDYAVINTGAIVEHDCVVEQGAAVSSGAALGGRVTIGRSAFVATGAIVLARLHVGEGAVVAAGSVVTRDVPPRTLVMGAPARVVRDLGEDFDWKLVL